jgi:MYXO-CTERM domain-containing protein
VGQAADELREDIERTREDMAETLDAIGDRISPRLQAERQMERLRRRGIEPKQIAMAAAALLMGLLFIRRRRHSGDGD